MSEKTKAFEMQGIMTHPAVSLDDGVPPWGDAIDLEVLPQSLYCMRVPLARIDLNKQEDERRGRWESTFD